MHELLAIFPQRPIWGCQTARTEKLNQNASETAVHEGACFHPLVGEWGAGAPTAG